MQDLSPWRLDPTGPLAAGDRLWLVAGDADHAYLRAIPLNGDGPVLEIPLPGLVSDYAILYTPGSSYGVTFCGNLVCIADGWGGQLVLPLPALQRFHLPLVGRGSRS